jgi:hypothetical protein
MDLTEQDVMDWVHLADDGYRETAVSDTVMKSWFP